MPVDEYHCDKCDHEVTLTPSISEHDKGSVKCPTFGGNALRALLSVYLRHQRSPEPERETD